MESNIDSNLILSILSLRVNIIGIIISSFLAIIGIFIQLAIYKNTQAIQKGQNEISVREMIENAKANAIKLSATTSDDNRVQAIIAADESVKNTYDEACKKYLENKIGRTAFKDMYKFEIKQLIEEQKKFYLINKEKYEATLKVYYLWFEKKNLKTKIKDFIMNNNKILKKILFSIIILLSMIGIWFLSDGWKNFLSIILVVLIGCLVPFLFDETDIIINHLKQIKDNTNEANYTTSIDSYNQLIFYFGQILCSFLILNFNQETKRKIQPPDSIDVILNSLQNLVSDNFHFERDINNPVWPFDPSSRDILIKAEGTLADINRILMFLPKELKFSRVRYAPFINLQSGFYQLKNQLLNDVDSEASEAVMNKFLRDFIRFVNISNED